MADVLGMRQHADGGVLATKPYASGGAYGLDRLRDLPQVVEQERRRGTGAA